MIEPKRSVLSLTMLIALALGGVLGHPIQAQIAELAVDLTPDAPAFSPASSEPRGFRTLADGVVVFEAREDDTGGGGEQPQLWVTRGTPESTFGLPARGRILAATDSFAYAVDQRFLFDEPFDQLWRTDGTPGGTFPLLDVSQHDFISATVLGETLLLTVEDDIWATEGTSETTRRVGTSLDFSDPSQLLPLEDRVVFVAEGRTPSGFFRPALWELDPATGEGRHVFSDPGFDLGFLLFTSGSRAFFASAESFEFPGFWSYDALTGEVQQLLPALEGAVQSARAGREGEAIFTMFREDEGTDLWRSDGTPAGTRRLTDLGGELSFPFSHSGMTWAAPLGEDIIFQAGDDLWRTGAQPGQRILLTPGCDEGACRVEEPQLLPLVGGFVFYFTPPGSFLPELWRTDGTPAGTRPFAELCPGGCGDVAWPPVNGPGGMYFLTVNADRTAYLWITDGTPGGARRLTTAAQPLQTPAFLSSLIGTTPEGNVMSLWGLEYGREPWVVKPDGSGARILQDIALGRESSFLEELIVSDDRALFWSRGQVQAVEADAASAWTVGDFGFFSEKGLFSGGGGAFAWFGDFDGSQVWALGEAAEDALQIGTLTRGRPRSPVSCLGGDFFLVQFGQDAGLWKVADGRTAVERIVGAKELGQSRFEDLICTGDHLVFLAMSFDEAILYRSDGSKDGTEAAAGLDDPFGLSARLSPPQEFEGASYFLLCDEFEELSLWRVANGDVVEKVLPESSAGFLAECADPFQAVASPVALEGALYFVGGYRDAGVTLWRTDGTAAGTEEVASNPVGRPFFGAANPELAVAELGVIFAQFDPVTGIEPWVADGSGARLLKDLSPGIGVSLPSELTAVGGVVYFVADDGVHGAELWRTDGTPEGTRLVHDLYPGAFGSEPEQLTLADDRLYFVADDGLTGRELWFLPLDGREPCRAEAEALCLNGRYKVEGRWEDFRDREGRAQARTLTEDTGLFWFFDEDNLETMVKVLDGRANNGHVWTFYGALSNVEYRLTVTDTETGLTRRYFNPKRNFASVGDTRSFGPLGASLDWAPASLEAKAGPAPEPILFQTDPQLLGTCTEGENRLCLQGGRFAVEVTWADFRGGEGDGTTVPLTDDTGAFWFFRNTNVELLVKVLDGRANNGHFWVFLGSLSNVDFDVTVTDTETGEGRLYQNRGRQFASFGDTQAF